jgi:hypothetical protein
MVWTSGTINCNGPGEVIMPMVIATAKSARPKMFQRVAALRRSAVPVATAIARRRSHGLKRAWFLSFVSQAAGVTACAVLIAALGYRIVFGLIGLGLVALGGSAVALLAHASLDEGTGAASRSERS